MNLFNKKESILNSSANALSLFTKATVALEKVVEQSQELVAKNDEKIKSLQADNEMLTQTAEKNNKIIENINKLLGL